MFRNYSESSFSFILNGFKKRIERPFVAGINNFLIGIFIEVIILILRTKIPPNSASLLNFLANSYLFRHTDRVSKFSGFYNESVEFSI